MNWAKPRASGGSSYGACAGSLSYRAGGGSIVCSPSEAVNPSSGASSYRIRLFPFSCLRLLPSETSSPMVSPRKHSSTRNGHFSLLAPSPARWSTLVVDDHGIDRVPCFSSAANAIVQPDLVHSVPPPLPSRGLWQGHRRHRPDCFIHPTHQAATPARSVSLMPGTRVEDSFVDHIFDIHGPDPTILSYMDASSSS